MSASHRLVAAFGGPELAWVRDRIRTHAAAGRPLPARLTRRSPTEAERRFVAALLGRRARVSGALEVDLGELEQTLRRSGAWDGGLVAAVEALDGPIVLRDDVLRHEQQAWDDAFAPLVAAAATRDAGDPVALALTAWIDELGRTGRVRRLVSGAAEAAGLLGDLASVVLALPSDGEPLPAFSARVLGSAHALDDGRPLASLAARAAEIVGGIPGGLPEQSPAARRRNAWFSAGVLRDELSSTVLVLNVPGEKTSPTGRILEEGRGTGQPLVLTLRQLVREAPVVSVGGRTVSICENPSVVAAAAERLGRDCAPLICVEGQPGAAAMALLDELRTGGAALRHHGDFDLGGMAIAGYLRRRHHVAPWRFGADDYRRAVDVVVSRTGRRPERTWSEGTALQTPWDQALAVAMGEIGIRIEEEHLLDVLLDDLAERPDRR